MTRIKNIKTKKFDNLILHRLYKCFNLLYFKSFSFNILKRFKILKLFLLYFTNGVFCFKSGSSWLVGMKYQISLLGLTDRSVGGVPTDGWGTCPARNLGRDNKDGVIITWNKKKKRRREEKGRTNYKGNKTNGDQKRENSRWRDGGGGSAAAPAAPTVVVVGGSKWERIDSRRSFHR